MIKVWNFFESTMRRIVGFFLKIIHKEITDEQWMTFMQLVKFCLVGASNAFISLAIYYIFVAINSELYIIGNAVGFVMSVLNSYFLNSKFVFKKENERMKTVIKTFIAYGANLLIGTGLLYLFVDILHISEYLAPFLNLVITVPLNYVLNKFWVMK